MLNHSCVEWFSDSQLACTIAQEGSMCRDLHGIAFRIYQFCLKQEIEFGRSHDDCMADHTRMFRRTRKTVGTSHLRLFCELLQCKNFRVCPDIATKMLRSGLLVQRKTISWCLLQPSSQEHYFTQENRKLTQPSSYHFGLRHTPAPLQIDN